MGSPFIRSRSKIGPFVRAAFLVLAGLVLWGALAPCFSCPGMERSSASLVAQAHACCDRQSSLRPSSCASCEPGEAAAALPVLSSAASGPSLGLVALPVARIFAGPLPRLVLHAAWDPRVPDSSFPESGISTIVLRS